MPGVGLGWNAWRWSWKFLTTFGDDRLVYNLTSSAKLIALIVVMSLTSVKLSLTPFIFSTLRLIFLPVMQLQTYVTLMFDVFTDVFQWSLERTVTRVCTATIPGQMIYVWPLQRIYHKRAFSRVLQTESAQLFVNGPTVRKQICVLICLVHLHSFHLHSCYNYIGLTHSFLASLKVGQ